MLVSFSFYSQGEYITTMLSAFVFLNCDIGKSPSIVGEISHVSGVSESVQVSGVYDIVAKVKQVEVS